MLLHGIMSSIAEFYSKNLATEVTKGLTQKFETGGTPMRAPIGYLNVRKRDDQGREYRTVEIDPDRAPLVRWVFEQYATGDRTVVDLLAEVTARGADYRADPEAPPGRSARSGFFKLLRNPYYVGIVRYKGAEQPGTHEPLIDIDTWQPVQTLLNARKIASERRRNHDHYLKGSLFCGKCGSRMQLDYPANKQGVRYAYYVCSGRASKRKNCTRRAVPVGVAEQLVADCYRDIAITEDEYTTLAAQVEAAFDERLASRSQELAELTENRRRLQNESDKLLAAHFADAIDLETFKRHQDRIRTGLADIDRRLASEHDQHEGSRKQLATALSLLVDCATLYAAQASKASGSPTRRSPTASRSAKTKGRRSGSPSPSPPSHPNQHLPMSGVLVRLPNLWTCRDSTPWHLSSCRSLPAAPQAHIAQAMRRVVHNRTTAKCHRDVSAAAAAGLMTGSHAELLC